MTQPTPSAVRGAPSAATDAYVINLCASTTPMALSRPTAPELARFTFFVSRRREEGRERFRLHMGYFATRDEAEQLLSLIRDLYPAAWVGEAPGKRLAQRAAAASPPAATAPAAKQAPPTPASAPAPAPAAATAKTQPAPATSKAAATAAPPSAPAAARPAASATAPAPPAKPAATRVPPSNVREVIESLDAVPAAPVAAPAPAAKVPPARAAGAVAPAAAAAARTAAVPPAAAASPPSAGLAAAPKRDELSDSQVLRILETRRANAVAQPATTAEPRAQTDIRMLSPDDTQTWRDIKSQLSRDAAVHFAVQLEWSVAPIDLDRVPPLAIFNAYTLYKIEGNRDGRKWYGLRLGFFSDAVAARQVAMYVRSEFATVAVVPVSGKERGDATQVGAIELSRPTAPVVAPAEDAIELIDDAVDAALSRSQQPSLELDAEMVKAPVLAEPAEPATAAGRRQGRPRGSPQTLEETLEILGASQLSIDNGKGVRLDLGSGQRRSEPRNSTFSKLLDRLSEKLRG
jgi:hypothetical protein